MSDTQGRPLLPDSITIFAGSGSPRLTDRICAYLGMTRGKSEALRFSEGNLFVRILENVRGHPVYVVSVNRLQRLEASRIAHLLMTNTVENQPVSLSDRIDVVSVAPLFGEAIRRICNRASISEMFPA